MFKNYYFLIKIMVLSKRTKQVLYACLFLLLAITVFGLFFFAGFCLGYYVFVKRPQKSMISIKSGNYERIAKRNKQVDVR